MGNGLNFPNVAGVASDQLRRRDGFIVGYSSTTAVAISSGIIEANGKTYVLSADTTHTMTSLASAFDHHYIYVDDSASTAPTAVIIDSVTEPVWSDTKRGWYNGDDLCIGEWPSKNGVTELMMGAAVDLGGGVVCLELPVGEIIMAFGMNPSGAWQTPNLIDGSVATPVNANKILFALEGADVGSTLYLYMANKEWSLVETSVTRAQKYWVYLQEVLMLGELNLGTSRDVRITGADDDNSRLGMQCLGYNYTR